MTDAVVPSLSSIIPARSQSQRKIRGENTRGGEPVTVVSHRSTGVGNVGVVKRDGGEIMKPARGRYMGKEQVGLGNMNGFNLHGQTDVYI